MTDTFLKDTRQKILDMLPESVEQVILEYGVYAQNEVPDKALDFIRHQNACKAALVRLDTLMRLTRWITSDGTELKKDTGETLLAALERARKGVASHLAAEKTDPV